MRKGSHHSEKTKLKISESLKGRRKLPFSEEHKRKMSEAKRGEKNSMFGKKLSDNHKVKISKGLKKFYETYDGYWKGKHRSEESIAKTVKSRKGYRHSEKTKQKISKALKGQPKSEEHRRKLSEAEKVRFSSEEERQKVSLAMMGREPWNKGLTKETDDRIMKVSESLKKLYEDPRNHPFYGRHRSDEAKRKIGNFHRGKILSEETKQKVREARLKQIFPIKDTSIEVALQEELTCREIPFKTHVSLFGQPDIFIEPNLCVFADGDYWHNYPYRTERDKKVNQVLKEGGYQIVRFWEREINSDIKGCVDQIVTRLETKYF